MRRMAERAAPGRGQDVSAVLGGAAYVTDLECRLAPSFERAAPRPHAMASRRGLWSPAARNNSGPLAEILGAAPPDAVQPRLRRALGLRGVGFIASGFHAMASQPSLGHTVGFRTAQGRQEGNAVLPESS
jgi:hypothetical protein